MSKHINSMDDIKDLAQEVEDLVMATSNLHLSAAFMDLYTALLKLIRIQELAEKKEEQETENQLQAYVPDDVD